VDDLRSLPSLGQQDSPRRPDRIEKVRQRHSIVVVRRVERLASLGQHQDDGVSGLAQPARLRTADGDYTIPMSTRSLENRSAG
jgi:hypothetical protein